ncbi:hypothetical protein L596_012466 [Steinernema carpocapsae]|uniref:Uncharacterized protein n=1 Tax=Steinernema carpocapsae TaxID=34508 RepID=A0A4U5NXY6_STECR|nr:hypothetical protein L596_012466 [Steinernema carpocapsae]
MSAPTEKRKKKVRFEGFETSTESEGTKERKAENKENKPKDTSESKEVFNVPISAAQPAQIKVMEEAEEKNPKEPRTSRRTTKREAVLNKIRNSRVPFTASPSDVARSTRRPSPLPSPRLRPASPLQKPADATVILDRAPHPLVSRIQQRRSLRSSTTQAENAQPKAALIPKILDASTDEEKLQLMQAIRSLAPDVIAQIDEALAKTNLIEPPRTRALITRRSKTPPVLGEIHNLRSMRGRETEKGNSTYRRHRSRSANIPMDAGLISDISVSDVKQNKERRGSHR